LPGLLSTVLPSGARHAVIAVHGPERLNSNEKFNYISFLTILMVHESGVREIAIEPTWFACIVPTVRIRQNSASV
jgi:hypothetical protein